MIPGLEDNVLPEGVHDCTPDEVEAAFGRFQRTDRRITLTERLKAYLAEAKRSGIVVSVVIDGSYVTAKDTPDDIDLLVALPADWVWSEDLKPFRYNAISKRMIRSGYRFDALVYPEGSVRYNEALDYFQKVNPDKDVGLTSRQRKGVLRVRL